MVVYDISGTRIRLRQASGDRFEFAIVSGVEPPVRLSCAPQWAEGRQPDNAEFLVYLARATAHRLAREAFLIH